jgi:hypothetical protein
MITHDISGNCRARCRQITPKMSLRFHSVCPASSLSRHLVEPHHEERPDQREAEGQRDGEPFHAPQEQEHVDQPPAHHGDIGEEEAHHRLAPEIAQALPQGMADIAQAHRVDLRHLGGRQMRASRVAHGPGPPAIEASGGRGDT